MASGEARTAPPPRITPFRSSLRPLGKQEESSSTTRSPRSANTPAVALIAMGHRAMTAGDRRTVRGRAITVDPALRQLIRDAQEPASRQSRPAAPEPAAAGVRAWLSHDVGQRTELSLWRTWPETLAAIDVARAPARGSVMPPAAGHRRGHLAMAVFGRATRSSTNAGTSTA